MTTEYDDACSLLTQLRAVQPDARWRIESLYECLKRGKLTLSDIKTDKAELHELEQQGYKLLITQLLEAIYYGYPNASWRLEQIRKHLHASGLTFAHFKVDEPDIVMLIEELTS